MIPMIKSSQAGHKPSRLLASDGSTVLPADMQAHTHSPGNYPFTVLHADRLEETVANHLISILASTVSHLQHQRAERNAVEQGQTQLWQNHLYAAC